MDSVGGVYEPVSRSVRYIQLVGEVRWQRMPFLCGIYESAKGVVVTLLVAPNGCELPQQRFTRGVCGQEGKGICFVGVDAGRILRGSHKPDGSDPPLYAKAVIEPDGPVVGHEPNRKPRATATMVRTSWGWDAFGAVD